LFGGRHKTGRLDPEAVEMAVRSTVHRAGAAVPTELLPFPAPAAGQRNLPCSCGSRAPYRGFRSKLVPTAVGKVEVARPYFLCLHCHAGQFPADVELDIQDTEFSPGVRPMQAVVGREVPFDQERRQIEPLAGLEATPQGVERTAEAIGADIARREQQEIGRAVPLELPVAWVRWSRFCTSKWTGRACRW
jgi:hypothetical protein